MVQERPGKGERNPLQQTKEGWRLRPADLHDIDGLHALAGNPLVYRYLFDGAPPDKEFITRRVAESVANAGETGLGMWFLEDVSTRYAGCVELRPYPSSRSAELTYLLDPRYWGQGLALRMAWTAITHAFLSSQIDSVIASAAPVARRSVIPCSMDRIPSALLPAALSAQPR
jgi:[ribosomal protein S5]-alanine N-acetyltransferase